MELPNYSGQLMQQLYALCKDGHFCDCTILVGDTVHHAHKLVLAAASLLFRSLLVGSDSISIDPALVTSQQFSILLEMAYTGRLPPGTHNLSHVIGAADNLQMFDMAVSCKSILASLTKQPEAATAPDTTTGNAVSPPESGQSEDVQKRTPKDSTECSGGADGREDLEFLSQRLDKITEIIGLVQPWVKAVEMWESISSLERKLILDCGRGESDTAVILQRLINAVREGKSLSTGTLLDLLGIFKEHRPELARLMQEEETPEETQSVAEAEGTVLFGHRAELIDALAGIDSLGLRLVSAAEECLGEQARQAVSQCCGGDSSKLVAERLLGSLQTDQGVSESDLLTLLQTLGDSSSVLLELLQRYHRRAEASGDEPESEAESLLKKYCSRLMNVSLLPQSFLHSTEALGAFSTEEREHIKSLLQDTDDTPCTHRLITEALEKGSVSALCVWQLLFKAAVHDTALEMVIQEVRDEGMEKIIHAAMDPESLLLDLLLKHKALILEAVCDLQVLRTGLEAAEEPAEDVSEFLSSLQEQEECRDVLQRVLENQSLPPRPFCTLLCLNRQSLPKLQPLFHDLDMAGTTAEVESKRRSSRRAVSKACFCQWCGKAFSFRCRMEVHRKRCRLSQDMGRPCPHCPMELPTPLALHQHLAQEHDESPARKKKRKQKAVNCDLCGKTFAHPSGMLYHKRTDHFDEKPYACQECGAKFAANSSLKNHLRLHTGERPFHCKHCDMSFSQAAALAYHTKKKHSEGKMYACQYCEAVFAQSIELTRHVRTHTGDKPYVCRECGRGFSQANGLSVHLHTFHNISDPHDCQKCRMSFPSLDEHRRHIQESHPRELHQCDVCSKIFNSPALLEKHVVTHVGGKPYNCKICHKSYQVTILGVQVSHAAPRTVAGSSLFLCVPSNCQACGTTTVPHTPRCFPLRVSDPSGLCCSVPPATGPSPAAPVCSSTRRPSTRSQQRMCMSVTPASRSLLSCLCCCHIKSKTTQRQTSSSTSATVGTCLAVALVTCCSPHTWSCRITYCPTTRGRRRSPLHKWCFRQRARPVSR